jgi:ABC-type sugar transport system permease subunit
MAATAWSHRSGVSSADLKKEPMRRRRHRLAESMPGYVFILPFLIIFAIFSIWPDIYALILSFEHSRGFGKTTGVGVHNYKAVLTYGVFWTELRNTVFYWVAHAIPLIPLAFALALLVRSTVVRAKEFWKAVIFLPQVMSIIAITLVFQTLFSTQYGVINQTFGTHVAWLTDFGITRWVVVFMLVWHGLGFWFIVFLAGLSSIDPSIDEAALIDGANAWQRIRFITIPQMRNVFLFAFVIDGINAIPLYTQPNVLTSNGTLAPPDVGPVMNVLVSNVQGTSFGMSSAVGWLLFIATAVLSALIYGISRIGRSA